MVDSSGWPPRRELVEAAERDYFVMKRGGTQKRVSGEYVPVFRGWQERADQQKT